MRKREKGGIEQESHSRIATLTHENRKLRQEIGQFKQKEATLEKSEQVRSALLNAVDHAMGIVELNGILIDINRTGAAQMGFSRDEAIGKNIYRCFPADQTEKIRGHIAEVIKTVQPVEWMDQEEDARLIHRYFPVVDADGALFLIVFSITGCSGNESLEKALPEAEKLLFESQLQRTQRLEAIGTLAGGIAHDFNNILTPIIMGTEMVQLAIPDGDPSKDHLRQVIEAAMRAKRLVSQILTFSRQSDTEKEPLHLIPIVKETLKFLRASLPSTIELKRHIDAKNDLVLASPLQIQQVVINLCTNAAQAMEEKGGILEVSLINETVDPSTHEYLLELNPGNYLKISVRDTGHGMDAHTLEQIFHPFFTTRERGEGTGMGLPVIHGVVKSCKGGIHVESKPGEGSAFHIFLPCICDASETDTETQDSSPKGKETLLFIDDEPMIKDIYKRSLENLGYTVVATNDPLEAMRLFEKAPEQFDLVITDQTMPGMTGLDLAKAFLRIRAGIPIILCTGFGEQHVTEKAGRAGIRKILRKPIIRAELANSIRELLNHTSR